MSWLATVGKLKYFRKGIKEIEFEDYNDGYRIE